LPGQLLPFISPEREAHILFRSATHFVLASLSRPERLAPLVRGVGEMDKKSFHQWATFT
jgi:hypothetical protein